MAQALTTPVQETKVVTTVQLTAIVNNVEEGRLEVHYITLLEDGEPYQRGNVAVEGKEAVQAVYAEIDTIMSSGKTFEEASKELFYSKVTASI